MDLTKSLGSRIPYRWRIGGLLFAVTAINYIDRQTLSVLAPFLKDEYHWTNADFATILIGFRVAYTIMQAVSGRILDRLGTRRGLSLSVAFYSVVACCTTLATGLNGFRVCRFLSGSGEAANTPGATKTVSEWFPDRERAWAVALFDSGSSIGGAVAPFLVLFLYNVFGSWRPAFLVTGSLGFSWLVIWNLLYRTPNEPPTREPQQTVQTMIATAGSATAGAQPRVVMAHGGLVKVGWRQLFGYRQTWGIVLGRMLLDPYWFLITEWFAVYLVSKGFTVRQSGLGFWAPFLAADLGNFFGGGLSSFWIKRGWPVGKSRRTVLMVFGPSMLLLALTGFTSRYVVLISLFAWTTFAYGACSTMFQSLPADVFHSRVVASVSGLGGTGAGVGTLISTYLIGQIADRFSFQPIIVGASIVPCIATAVFVTMVRASKKPDPNQVLLQF